MISEEKIQAFRQKSRRQHVEKLRHDLADLEETQRVLYLREMTEKAAEIEVYFTAPEPRLTKNLFECSPDEIIAAARSSREAYAELKSIVWHELSVPNPFQPRLSQELLMAVLKDLSSPFPEPKGKPGTPVKEVRNQQIVELFALLKDTGLYRRRLGTNPATLGATAVDAVAEVFCLSASTVRKIIQDA